MESNKHNDELIKRKLADLNAEPRKLDFATVHANYEKARQTSSSKWGIYLFVSGIAIAVFVSTYIMLMPATDRTVAQNDPTASEHPANNANSITSVGTSTEDKFAERRNSENNTNTNTSIEEESNNPVANNSSANDEAVRSEKTNTKEETASTVKKETSAKENNTATVVNKNTNATNAISSRKNETKLASKVEKIKTSNNASNDNKKEELASNTKSNDNVPITRSGNARGMAEKKKTSNSKKNSDINKDLLAANSDQNANSEQSKKDISENNSNSTTGSNTGGENLKSEGNTNANKETSVSNEQKSELTVQHNNSNEETKKIAEAVKTDTVTNFNDLTQIKVDTAGTHIPGVIGTGSVSPRNKHKWLVGAEASYNTIFYNGKENPNAPSQFSTGDPAFATAFANAVGKGKHSLISGMATFGYLYNEQIGITAGISYLNLKYNVDLQPNSTPVYTTAVDYYVWANVTSTTTPPTLTYMIIDTVYKQVQTGNTTMGATVNGNTVSTTTFENNIRYISIPLHLSYNFKIGAKFFIEPQAGIVYTMPLKSNHLVATDAYIFEHGKQRADLRKNLYINTALKLGYNVSNKMQVYVRGGYFFRNQSIYNADQPITMSLKSIYTSFGMTFRIK